MHTWGKVRASYTMMQRSWLRHFQTIDPIELSCVMNSMPTNQRVSEPHTDREPDGTPIRRNDARTRIARCPAGEIRTVEHIVHPGLNAPTVVGVAQSEIHDIIGRNDAIDRVAGAFGIGGIGVLITRKRELRCKGESVPTEVQPATELQFGGELHPLAIEGGFFGIDIVRAEPRKIAEHAQLPLARITEHTQHIDLYKTLDAEGERIADVGAQAIDGEQLLVHRLHVADAVVVEHGEECDIEAEPLEVFATQTEVGIEARLVPHVGIHAKTGVGHKEVVEVDGLVVLREVGIDLQKLPWAIAGAETEEREPTVLGKGRGGGGVEHDVAREVAVGSATAAIAARADVFDPETGRYAQLVGDVEHMLGKDGGVEAGMF
jgi:hypothetical protein